jgi:hypothetical protein
VYVPDEHADFIERLTDPTKYSAHNLVKENLLALQALEGLAIVFIDFVLTLKINVRRGGP